MILIIDETDTGTEIGSWWTSSMDNIFIRIDPAGNITADKEKSTEKIDRAICNGNVNFASVYDDRGLFVL